MGGCADLGGGVGLLDGLEEVAEVGWVELFEVEGSFAADDGVGIVEAVGEEFEDVDGGVVDGLAIVLGEGEGVAQGHEAVVGDLALEGGEEGGVA